MSYSAKQKKVRVSVEGADEIVRTLKEMGEAASAVLEKGAKAGGEIALKYARDNCPVDTGALKNSLALSVDKTTEEKSTVKVDYDKSLYYGTFVELGTKHNKANPFLRNAIDSNQKEINEVIAQTVSNAVKGAL